MKRMIIGGAAIVLAVTPAVIGLWSNPSFSATVPVRVPASGQIVLPSPSPSASDDHGGDTPRDQRTEPGDDRDAASPSPSPSPSTSRSGDDHGGDTPRDQRTEPGDDRRGGDDSGRHGGSGRGSGHGSDDGGGRHGGHGSDD